MYWENEGKEISCDIEKGKGNNMLNTGLGKYMTATVDNFTSDTGIKIRRVVNSPWRTILKCRTKEFEGFCNKRISGK